MKTIVAVALAIMLLANDASSALKITPTRRPTVALNDPAVGGCELFPLDVIFHADVRSLQTRNDSGNFIRALGESTVLRADFKTIANGGLGVNLVRGNSQRKVKVEASSNDSDSGMLPIPAKAKLQGNGRLIVLDVEKCNLIELFKASKTAKGFKCEQVIQWELNKYEIRHKQLPVFPLLVRFEEIEAGTIRHMIRFSSNLSSSSVVWPAAPMSTLANDPNIPPYGTVFRLKSTFNLTPFSEQARVILRAMQKHGMILAAGGDQSFYFSGQAHAGFLNGVLEENMSRIKGSDFEAVDISALMMDVRSYRINQMPIGVPPTPSPQTKIPNCPDIVPGSIPNYDRTSFGTYCCSSDYSNADCVFNPALVSTKYYGQQKCNWFGDKNGIPCLRRQPEVTNQHTASEAPTFNAPTKIPTTRRPSSSRPTSVPTTTQSPTTGAPTTPPFTSVYEPSIGVKTNNADASLGGTCNVFPRDSVWNANITNLLVHSNSANYINAMGINDRLHADFSSLKWDAPMSNLRYGIPFNVVNSSSQPLVEIKFNVDGYSDESDAGFWPIPANTAIEGGSDRHAIVLDVRTCRLYELYHASKNGDGSFNCDSSATWNMNEYKTRTMGWTSADAAGLPIFPGLLRFEELEGDNEIHHALRVTAELVRGTRIWPATHETSISSNVNLPPYGTRFRLKKSVDISAFSKQAQKVLRAMKTYGLILADGGSNWYIQGSPHAGWLDSILVHDFNQIQGSQFEVVDASSLMVSETSYQIKSKGVGEAFTRFPSPNVKLPKCADIVPGSTPQFRDANNNPALSPTGVYCAASDFGSSLVLVSPLLSKSLYYGDQQCDWFGYDAMGIPCAA